MDKLVQSLDIINSPGFINQINKEYYPAPEIPKVAFKNTDEKILQEITEANRKIEELNSNLQEAQKQRDNAIAETKQLNNKIVELKILEKQAQDKISLEKEENDRLSKKALRWNRIGVATSFLAILEAIIFYLLGH